MRTLGHDIVFTDQDNPPFFSSHFASDIQFAYNMSWHCPERVSQHCYILHSPCITDISLGQFNIKDWCSKIIPPWLLNITLFSVISHCAGSQLLGLVRKKYTSREFTGKKQPDRYWVCEDLNESSSIKVINHGKSYWESLLTRCLQQKMLFNAFETIFP